MTAFGVWPCYGSFIYKQNKWHFVANVASSGTEYECEIPDGHGKLTLDVKAWWMRVSEGYGI